MTDQSSSAEEKIAGLEKTLALDARLQALEAAIQERLPAERPWWKDAKVVTFLGALIAAILPVATWISNVYASSRESNRLLIEQQEKIRQTYLERVFRPGITEAEQEEVFGLLARLSSDRELQAWARDELQRTKDAIAELKKAKEHAEQRLADSQATVASLNAKVSQLTVSERKTKADAAAAVSDFQRQIAQLNHQLGQRETDHGTHLAHLFSCAAQLQSDPPGALVTIATDINNPKLSSSKLGYTPISVELMRSMYYIAMEKPGFQKIGFSLDLRSGDNCEVFEKLVPQH